MPIKSFCVVLIIVAIAYGVPWLLRWLDRGDADGSANQ